MAFVTAAVIAGGAALAGGALAANAAKNAANTQANAANNAANMTQAQFNTTNAQQAPYRNAGYAGLNQLSYLLGLGPRDNPQQSIKPNFALIAQDPGMQSYYQRAGVTPAQWQAAAEQEYAQGNYGSPSEQLQVMQTQLKNAGSTTDLSKYIQQPTANGSLSAGAASMGIAGAGSAQSIGAPQDGYGSLLHQFNTSDLNANLAPSYQFMLDQGRGALENAATRSGGLLAGNTLQGLNKFTQDYASTGYQQAYNNFTNNQNNIYNRLAGIAGIGQNANQLTAQTGAAAAGNAGNYLVGGANATAAGQVGSANAINQGLSNAAGWAYLSGRPAGGGGGGEGGGTNAAGGIRF